jgi:hypothetical protein
MVFGAPIVRRSGRAHKRKCCQWTGETAGRSLGRDDLTALVQHLQHGLVLHQRQSTRDRDPVVAQHRRLLVSAGQGDVDRDLTRCIARQVHDDHLVGMAREIFPSKCHIPRPVRHPGHAVFEVERALVVADRARVQRAECDVTEVLVRAERVLIAGPQAVFVELKAFGFDAAEHHGAKPPVADG